MRLSVRRRNSIETCISRRNKPIDWLLFRFTDIETDEIITTESLEYVDLRKNPLTPQCLDRLRGARVSFHIDLPERIKEDWEDLDV